MSKVSLIDNAQEFINLSVDYFCLASSKGYFLDLSSNWEQLLGYSMEELTSQPFSNFVHPDDLERTADEMQDLLERKTEYFVNRYIRNDGQIVSLSWRAAMDKDKKHIYAVATDVSESQANQRLLEITQKTANIGGWKVDITSNTCHWSDQVYKIHEVVPGTPIKVEDGINYYTPEHRPIITKCVEEGIKNNKPWDVELQIITAKGKKRWVRAIGTPVLSQGKLVRLEGIFQDIHDRKSKELEVFRNNALLKATFDSFPASLVFTNTDREILEVSRHFEESFGYTADEAKGRTTKFLYKNPDDFTKKSAKKFNIEADSDLTPYEMEYVRKDGTSFWAQTIGSVIKGEKDEPVGFIGAIRDLTHEKEQQALLERERARLVQASKMSTLGEMAGGIAHEINNPLAIIQAYAHKLEAIADRGEEISSNEVSDLAGSMLSAVDRVAKIIYGLRIFARDGRNETGRTLTAKQLIDSTLSFCEKRFLNHDIQLDVKGDLDAKIFGQEIQLSQVLLNLLNNAFDAVRSEGAKKSLIEIEANAGVEKTDIHIHDWGPGIDSDNINRILEPFFTTKEIGQGTGLGLSISKGLLEDQSGQLTITCSNNPTTFTVSLPNTHKNT